MRALSLIVAIALLTISAAPGARADMDRPTWSTGDFWEYVFSGLPFGGAGGPFSNGTLRIDVLGSDSVTVGGITYPSYHTRMKFNLTMSGGGITITVTMDGESWFRTSDLGLAKQVLVMPAFFGSGSTTITATYAPPQERQWPLKAGATWTATSLVTTVTTGGFGIPPTNATQSTSHSVQGEVQTTVLAGTFTTFPVRGNITGGGYGIEFWAGSVGNAARIQAFDQNDQQLTSADLRSFQYQAGSSFGFLLLLLLLLMVIVAIVAAVALMRRKKGGVIVPPGPQQPWQQPLQPGPPQQVPQEPWQPEPPKTPP